MDTLNLEEAAMAYFASMSHLACKMMQHNESIKEMYRDTWESLSWEKQEELLDEHVFDPRIVDKYSSLKKVENPPSCFPILKINSGEKVIVDFEHEDGWTWTDEHSAPFSWKTKSQQDLTLVGLEDQPTSKDESNKKGRMRKKSRSPDCSMFDSTAVAGDRSKNEVEKMFEKFGIKVPGYSDDEDRAQEASSKDADMAVSPSHIYNERSKLLDDDASEYKDSAFGSRSDADVVSGSAPASANTGRESKGKVKKEKGQMSQEQEKGAKEKTNKKKKSTVTSKEVTTKKTQPPSDQIAPLEASMFEGRHAAVPFEAASFRPSAIEMASPIRFADIGESSTDDLCENKVTDAETCAYEMPSDLAGPAYANESFGYDTPVITSQPKKFDVSFDTTFKNNEQVETKTETVVRTGFDFLDNW